MAYELRELTVGQILDQSIRLLKDRFGLLLGVTSVLYLPMLVFSAWFQIAMMPDATTVQEGVEPALLLFSSLIFMVFALVAIPITWGAVIHAVARIYLDEPVTVGESIRAGVSRAVPLIWSMFIMYFAIFGGLLLLIIPGILCMLWFALTPQVAVLEKMSGTKALGRSRALVRGSLGKVFVLAALVAIVNWGAGFLLALIPDLYVQRGVGLVIEMALFTFGTTASVVLYFSCRCGAENFDLVRLAELVHSPENDPSVAVSDT